jgi:hypothetical protein
MKSSARSGETPNHLFVDDARLGVEAHRTIIKAQQRPAGQTKAFIIIPPSLFTR